MHDPDIVVAADWSTSPQKRWMARAERTAAGYRISHPVPVGDLEKLLARIRAYAKGGSALVGFDFPIGLPHEYARRRFAEANFRAILPQLDARFFEPTNEPEAGRPFGPASSGKGGLGPGWLAAKLELNQEQLRRECDRCTKANPLFFTLGARQVGRAAATGWQEVLKPGLDAVRLWPFDGTLAHLLQPGNLVIAEIYPGLFYREAIDNAPILKGEGKETPKARQEVWRALLDRVASEGIEIELTESAEEWVEAGFYASDDFDAMLGVLGMLRALKRGERLEPPESSPARWVEGWMLGLRAST